MSFWSRNWWVVLFCSLTFLIHFHCLKEKKKIHQKLSLQLHEMQVQKIQALQQKEEFEHCLASQNDPAWIELVLMRDLGVVPEGYLKVHFVSSTH